MARQLVVLLLVTGLAWSCAAATSSVPKPAAVRASRSPARPTPAQTPATGAQAEERLAAANLPATTAAAEIPIATAPPSLLLPPSTAHQVLSGQVTIDGAYAIQRQVARLIARDQANLLQLEGTRLGPTQGNLVSNNGAGLIAGKAGPGSLVSNNGASLISDAGGSYRLLGLRGLFDQNSPLPLGEILPVNGLILYARNLQTGELVALGVDEQKQPVYAIESNAQGAFTIFLPSDVPTIILDTRMLDSQAQPVTDARLAYKLLSPAQAGETRLDEDSAVASEYILQAAEGTLADFVVAGNEDYLNQKIARSVSPLLRDLTLAVVKELRLASKLSGLEVAAAAQRRKVTRRIAEMLLGRVDLPAVKLNPLYAPAWKGEAEPAMQALIEVLRRAREASTTKLRADPTFFENQPYLQSINAAKPDAASRWAIEKPADLNRFVIEEYIIPDKSRSVVRPIFEGIGLTSEDVERLFATINTLMGETSMLLFSNREGAKDEMLAIIRDWKRYTE